MSLSFFRGLRANFRGFGPDFVLLLRWVSKALQAVQQGIRLSEHARCSLAALRPDFDAADLRRRAKASQDAIQARRLLVSTGLCDWTHECWSAQVGIFR